MQEVYKKTNKDFDDAMRMREAINLIEGIDNIKRVEELRKIQNQIYHRAVFKRKFLEARSESNGRSK